MAQPQIFNGGPGMQQFMHLERMRGQLVDTRQPYISDWQDLAAYFLPRGARFQTTEAGRGGRRSRNIVDSSALLSLRVLRAGMMSGITSPARPWFKLTTPDADLAEHPAVKEWLHLTTQRMSSVFLKSNLYNVLPTIYGTNAVFATAAMAVMEDDEDVIRCFPFPIGSFAIANNHKLQVRTFMREFTMTVQQIVEMFGRLDDGGRPRWDNISDRVKRLWENSQYQDKIDVVHIVCPNWWKYEGEESEYSSSEKKKFSSVYYEKGGDQGKLLSESGFDEYPVLCPRWETTGEDAYGSDSPGWLTLGDQKQLQLGERKSMQAIEKLVNPPMMGPEAMKRAKASILPGDITYVDVREGQQGFKPVHEVKPDIMALEGKQDKTRYRLARGWFEDLFLMLSQSDRREITAREVDERHEEKLLALGPVLEQLNQDLLDPLIDRTFGIMLRRGEIPTPPQELEGQALRVEYVSIMAQAQKMVGLSALERFAGFVGGYAKVDPSVLDKVSGDELVNEYHMMTGVAPKIIRTEDEVATLRQNQAKAKQAQQEAETLATAAGGAKALSETNTTDRNGLTDLMSGLGRSATNGQLPA